MTDLVERLRGIYRVPITDGLGPAGGLEPENPKEFVRQFETAPIQREAADEIERLRAGIKRLSDEEELCAETTGDDPFSMVYLAAKLAHAEADNERLRKALAAPDWYWPEDDTSSEACADGPWQIAENHDTGPGEVFGYSRGGVIETRYFGYLDPAEDADSDDNFEVDEPTQEAAEAKIAAELARRAALKANEGDHG